MERTRKKIGRPAGKDYPHAKLVRMADDDVERVQALAEQWRCSEAAAIRRAIQESAQREAARQRRNAAAAAGTDSERE